MPPESGGYAAPTATSTSSPSRVTRTDPAAVRAIGRGTASSIRGVYTSQIVHAEHAVTITGDLLEQLA
jgi:hypothetical protein